MRRRVFLILLMLFSAQYIHAEVPQINGAFGIKLGDEPDKKYIPEQIPTKIGQLYFIDPPIKNDHFNEYAVLVTFRTNKIFRIYAEKEQTTASCKEELTKLRTSLETIYGKVTEKDSIYMVKQKEKEIQLTCKVSEINNKDASLQIKYIDHQVYKDGLEINDSKSNDARGL